MSDEQDKASGSARPTGKRGKSGSTVTMPRPKVRKPSGGGDASKKRNPFAQAVQFLREVIAELKKVIWPTKNEWLSYTIVVLVFVVVVIGATTGLDIGFGQAVAELFG